MYRLKELVLQRIGMTKTDLINISEFIQSMQSLKILNIAANGLTQADFVPFFENLQPQVY